MIRQLSVCLYLTASLAAAGQVYKNPAFTASQRADDLLRHLTLEEKVQLMQNSSPAIPRLGIPAYDWWNEALHGVARAGYATVFPQAIGMAASFDAPLLYKTFTAISDEARVKNRLARRKGDTRRYQGLTFWTPNVNIFRDPRWGRGQETYGEDPYLSAQLGMAAVRGLQGSESARYDKAHACAKHFAVHSGPEWNRHSFNAENIAPRDLWETYLPAFKDLVQKADVKEVMCAYNRFEGSPCCGSTRLLTRILRDEWHFKGVVVSDCGAVNDFFKKHHHETSATPEDASATAVLSGTDLECGQVYKNLPKAVADGKIEESAIDTAVHRLLKARFELGEMDATTPWDTIPESVLCSQEHRRTSLQMARESMVLLQNKDNILPFKKGVKIALIGPNANDSVMQWGNYSGTPTRTVTLLRALQGRLPAANLSYAEACSHVDARLFKSAFGQCRTAGGKGFDAVYWSNDSCSGAPVGTTRQTVPFHLTTDGATVFAPNVPLKGFSADYTTTFVPDHDGPVAFKIQMRGAFELWVDGKMVYQKQGAVKQPTEFYTMDVKKGKAYGIRLRFRDVQRRANLTFDLGEKQEVDIPGLIRQTAGADVVVFAGGISPLLEGEEMGVNAPGFKGGDRTDIQLPAIQREVMAALKKAGRKVVFVNFSGSAVGMVPETASCEAIVQAWYPGEEGGTAVADVLFGDYNPAGRLPVTFYKDTLQLPDFQDYSMAGRTYRFMKGKPLYPFGYGLSYTAFSYGAATVRNGVLVVPVANTGGRDGDEVVQLYVNRPDDTGGPVKTLRGFQRVSIPAGKTVNVEFPLTGDTFLWWNKGSNTVRPLPGDYKLFYGGSSDERQLKSVMYRFTDGD